jgi:membrane protein implicated in regulation of membrane protease activity
MHRRALVWVGFLLLVTVAAHYMLTLTGFLWVGFLALVLVVNLLLVRRPRRTLPRAEQEKQQQPPHEEQAGP